jgi:hypothetical protein
MVPARRQFVERAAVFHVQSDGMNPKIWLQLWLVWGGVLLVGHCPAAIIYPEPPADGRQVVSQGLKEFPASMSRYLRGFELKDLTIGQPCRSYRVETTNLVSSQLLSAAKSDAWRYPLMHGTNVIASAELTTSKENGSLEFAGIDTTDLPEETQEAIQKAEQLPQVKAADYEIRCLNCPPILFVAIWLHGKTDDIIIPLPPDRGQWNAYQPYSESGILQLLKPAAEKRLKAGNGILN